MTAHDRALASAAAHCGDAELTKKIVETYLATRAADPQIPAKLLPRFIGLPRPIPPLMWTNLWDMAPMTDDFKPGH
jgi:hypothetical protein